MWNSTFIFHIQFAPINHFHFHIELFFFLLFWNWILNRHTENWKVTGSYFILKPKKNYQRSRLPRKSLPLLRARGKLNADKRFSVILSCYVNVNKCNFSFFFPSFFKQTFSQHFAVIDTDWDYNNRIELKFYVYFKLCG